MSIIHDNTDLLKIFANDQRMILYRPEWRTFTGSVTSTILLQQILYRWDKNGRKPFYKFKEPCGHDLYRPGDSWTEELGFSKKEFDSALKRIGTKVTQKEPGPTTSLVEYWTDINRITYYNINPAVLQGEIDKLYASSGGPSGSTDPGFTKSPKGDLYVKPKRGFRKITNEDLLHYKTKTTYKNDNVQPVKSNAPEPGPQETDTLMPSPSFSESELVSILAGLMSLVPEAFRKPSVETVIKKGLKSHLEDYVRLAVLYSIAHSNGGTVQKFKAFLGKSLENHWHDGFEPDSTQVDPNARKQAFLESRRRMPNSILKVDAANGCQASAQVLKERGIKLE